MPDLAPYDALHDAVGAWVTLGASAQQRLTDLFERRDVAAGAHVALPGDAAHEILFVARGLLRFYYPSDTGTDANKAFVREGDFAGAVASAQLALPIVYGIEALDDTTLLAAPYRAFAALMDDEPALERLGRKLAERLLVRKELRARSLLQDDARARYLAFLDAEPELAQRVPLYHVASYLGMTDVHLSRIRREIATRAA